MKLVMNRCTALVSVFACVVAMLPSCTGQVELVLGEPVIVVQGIRPEEKLWGPYQFPVPYQMGDRIVVSVHVSDDSFTSYADPYAGLKAGMAESIGKRSQLLWPTPVVQSCLTGML